MRFALLYHDWHYHNVSPDGTIELRPGQHAQVITESRVTLAENRITVSFGYNARRRTVDGFSYHFHDAAEMNRFLVEN